MKSRIKKIFGKDNVEYTVKQTMQPVEETRLILEDLNEKEKEFIENSLGRAAELLKGQGMTGEAHLFNPDNIDKAIELWFVNNLEQTLGMDTTVYSDILASAWGQFLIDSFGMQWHVITDNYGTEVGLYHKNNNTTIMPFVSMMKAFNNRNFSLISIITEQVKEAINAK